MYYFEITLLPDLDVSLNNLWSQLYKDVHIAFVDVSKKTDEKFGVSFPLYENDRTLGTKLRIFGRSQGSLKALELPRRIQRYSDYVHITTIREVPSEKIHSYALYSRVHEECGNANKTRRYAKRHEVPFIFHDTPKLLKSPFVWLKSSSTSSRFPLFIQKNPAPQGNTDFIFSSYGLSKVTAVPEF